MLKTSDDGIFLSWKDLETACSNIGFDITCGVCACLFFTGTDDGVAHDNGCKSNRIDHGDIVVTNMEVINVLD